MSLSSDLISQFVKITNDKTVEKKETTVYGKVVEYNGKNYVQLDGSDQLTPMSTTVDAKPGERVAVLIKNHTATVTGNMSSPSARSGDVEEIAKATATMASKITEFEIAIGDKVDVDELNAVNARIDILSVDNVTIKETLNANDAIIKDLQANNITIQSTLTAHEADIKKLQTEKLDAFVANITYATIESLEATNADIHNLEATYGEFTSLTANQLLAHGADINKLKTDKLDASTASIVYATVESLQAEQAKITNLQSDVADLDTLIFGSASGSVIHSSFANAVIAQLGNAQIKSAMIDNISADKITSGDVITNNVRVMSEDGKLLISDETLQISDNTRVRVQIGKDASNDYSINIWDQNGNLMFSKGGITDSAIKDAIIRNDMVSDTANIAAHKLDIDSLFEEINGSSKTIKSSKIYLDDENQTLDVVFESMSTDLDDLGATVTSQGTQITVIQNQITSKVWKQDINEATNTLNTQYSTLDQKVDSISATVASHTTEISTNRSQIQQTDQRVTAAVERISSNEASIASLEVTADSLTSRVSTTEHNVSTATTLANQAQSDIDNLEIGGRNLYENSANLTVDSIGRYFAPETPPYTVTSEEDPQTPSGKCLICAIGEIGTPLTNGGFYLNAAFGNYIPKMIEGEMYTVSVWIKCNRNISMAALRAEFLAQQENISMPNISTEWQRYIIRGIYNGNTTSSVAITFYYNSLITSNDIFYVSSPMIEKGNRASDWVKAPEDMATSDELANVQSTVDLAEERVTTAESLIQQLSECISTLVTDGNGESLMTQTANGWTFSTKQLQDVVNETSEGLDNLINDVGDINSVVDILERSVTELGILNDYVKITTYENEPCIELGETDSDFKLLITNTRIMFKEGASVPAYINNQSLFIKKAVIEEELEQGSFIWKARANGNLGLIWKGGE